MRRGVMQRVERAERYAATVLPAWQIALEKRLAEQDQRFNETLERFEEMLPPDLVERVQESFGACRLPDKPRSCHRLYAWLTHVSLGCARLPPYLTPDLVLRLVQI